MELTTAEQVLLSITDGVADHDLEDEYIGYDHELLYLRRLRSCTRYDYYMSQWVKLPNYDEVMSQPISL